MTTLAYTQALGLAGADGASYNTSVTLTDISPGGIADPKWFPGGEFLKVGTEIELDAWGTYQVNATTPTLLLGFYLGGVAGVALGATSAVTVTNSATVNWKWRLHLDCVIQATGTSGKISCDGYSELSTSLTAVTRRNMPEVAWAQTTIDTTVQKAITVGAQWSASAAGNIAICRFLRVRVD
jgi:hypothetical protein